MATWLHNDSYQQTRWIFRNFLKVTTIREKLILLTWKNCRWRIRHEGYVSNVLSSILSVFLYDLTNVRRILRIQLSGRCERRATDVFDPRARTKVNRFAARISRVQVHARRPTPLPMDLQTYFWPFKDGRSSEYHPMCARNKSSFFAKISRVRVCSLEFPSLANSSNWQSKQTNQAKSKISHCTIGMKLRMIKFNEWYTVVKDPKV